MKIFHGRGQKASTVDDIPGFVISMGNVECLYQDVVYLSKKMQDTALKYFYIGIKYVKEILPSTYVDTAKISNYILYLQLCYLAMMSKSNPSKLSFKLLNVYILII